MTIILQSATGIKKCDNYITKCDRYYKVRQVLQSATIITKCDSTGVQVAVKGKGWMVLAIDKYDYGIF